MRRIKTMANCDICGKPAEPMQGLYGARGDGGKSGPRFGDLRHYDCHTATHGKPYSGTMTGLFNDIRVAHDAALKSALGLPATVPVIPPRVIKVPFVTKGQHNRSENAQRAYKTTGRVISEMGKRRVEIQCPFCNARFWAYPWSIAGVGKKCTNCGSMHTSFGVAYPLFGNENL
jgi:hypothetical protein